MTRNYADKAAWPPIRRIGELSPNNAAAANGASDGLSSLLGSGSKAVEQHRLSDDDLLIWLTRKVYQAENARKRASWFGGRFYNRMTNESPHYLEMSGVHLAQVLALVGFDAPPWVIPKGRYLLRYDLAEGAYQALRKSLDLPPVEIGSVQH
ncbi:MAG: hypothetical protein DI616_13825 [Paracoccus denitrificans]|uniref:Uncharacterized protein n=1 Tax=Paracoccus denitrificans TaxID=266 RepID=A0A533I1W0_PARDE|nr:MAG: hypothetical protein DI616_13825 [Paracoccus denitrificans]